MDFKRIKIHHLVGFHCVVEQGSIRAASREMQLSQPALTRTMKELEELTGLALMIRHSGGVSLTEPGQCFLEHTRIILKDLERAEESLRQRHNQFTGCVSVGMSGGIACALLPEVVSRFCQHYPEASLNICEEQTDTLMVKLRNGELDFCITTLSPRMLGNTFEFEPLLALEFGIFTRQDHPLDQQQVISMRELYHQHWIMPPVRLGYHNLMLDFYMKNELSPVIPVRINSILTIPGMLSKTDFLSILPVSFVQSSIWREELSQLKTEAMLPEAKYYLMRRKKDIPSLLSLQVIEYIKMAVRQMI